jgi:hypothetical protein
MAASSLSPWGLLHSKPNLSGRLALHIILGSVSAAHACAQAINRQSVNIVKIQTRGKLRDAFKRIANCTKRAPAKLRRRLNETIIPLIRGNPIDLEVIEAIFDATVATFTKFPKEEAAKTALRLMCGKSPDGKRTVVIKSDYSVLGDACQRKAENAIVAIGKSFNDKTTASDVFNALALALDSRHPQNLSTEIHTLIVLYVTAVADVWRDAGLKPSRAKHPENPKYKSKFHRFADLVLTAVIEPWSNRHGGDLDAVSRDIRMAYAETPQELMRAISPRLRRYDTEWLVSEDHVKKALRMGIQKTDRDTP